MCVSSFSKCKLLMVLLVIVIGYGTVVATVDVPASWHGLTPGEYAVGFATIEKYDLSRTYSASQDYFGNPIEGETARPIQICYWYPAVAEESSSGMIYGEYAYPYPEDSRFINILSALQNRELGLLGFFLNNNRGLLTSAMNVGMYGLRDAKWADGKFPVIIMHNDANSTYLQNLVLGEYLASRGYIVVTTHNIGPAALDPTRSAIDVETLARDKEFALGEMLALEQVDKNRIGLIGAAFGSLSALVQTMRSSEIDALVLIESTDRVANRDSLLTGSLFYQPGEMSVPMLQIYSSDSVAAEDRLRSMFSYSDRTTINRSQSTGMDFMSYLLITRPLVDTIFETGAHATYLANCEDIALYFDDNIKQLEVTESLVEKYNSDEQVLASFYEAEKAPPTATQFMTILTSGNAEQAIELEEKFKMFSPEYSPVAENRLNMTGYQYLQTGRAEIAVEIFKMATKGFPESPNVWDSYGEGCRAVGDNVTALASYKKALELVQADGANIAQNLRDAILNAAPGIIEQLEQLIAEQENGGGNN